MTVPAGMWRATVTRVTAGPAGGPWVRVPRLGGEYEYGPLAVVAGAEAHYVGQRVLVSFLEGVTDQLVIIGSLEALVAEVVPVGQLAIFAGAIPGTFLACNGAAVSRATYADLFAAIGVAYGPGDGSTTFNVPNLAGRVPVGVDPTDPSIDVPGELVGAKTVALGAANLPPHAHAIDHDHAAVTSSLGSADHAHSGSTGPAGAHTHLTGWQGGAAGAGNQINIDAFAAKAFDASNVMSTAADHSHSIAAGGSNHTHSVDLPAFVGSSGNGPGTATAVSLLQPSIAVRYGIKT